MTHVSCADDKTRVKLQSPPPTTSNYINASHIDVSLHSPCPAPYLHHACPSLLSLTLTQGYHKLEAYIATETPLTATVENFWKMVWEQKCATIVMLSQESSHEGENGESDCQTYWQESGVTHHDNLQVICHSVTDYPSYILRDFKLVDTKVYQ